MKTIINYINESQKLNWNMTPEQILAVFAALSYADGHNVNSDLAKLVHIDDSVFDELWEDFGNVIKDNIIDKIDTYKDLENQDNISKEIKKLAK